MKQLDRNIKKSTDEPVFSQASFLSSKSKYYGWFDIEGEKIPYIIDKRLVFKRLIITYFKVKGNENEIFMKILDKVKNLDIDVVKLQNNVILPEVI
ncbi:MAG: hypothetical protein GY797_25695, partial [Deltaproteobacteria bacterium]|nr:hypothetical protein [Deltaproteobacteria bacterium]